MTPEETAQAAKPVVVRLGAAFGHEPEFVDRGERLGLGSGRWPFYFGGRAGVLGTVGADVVAAACGFFAPDLVRDAWDVVLAADRLDEVVRADVELCVGSAHRHLRGLPGLERLAALTSRVVESADASGRVLFAAWRALPDPSDDAAARAGLNLLRLREHRGGSHLIAVVAAGLTPVQAILAGPGSRKAAANGWQPPYPEIPDGAARLAEAERRTDVLAGQPYGVLRTEERAEVVALLGAVQARWREETPVSHPG